MGAVSEDDDLVQVGASGRPGPAGSWPGNAGNAGNAGKSGAPGAAGSGAQVNRSRIRECRIRSVGQLDALLTSSPAWRREIPAVPHHAAPRRVPALPRCAGITPGLT